MVTSSVTCPSNMTPLPCLKVPVLTGAAGAAQVRGYLVRDFNAKQASGYVWTEGDVEWSPRNTILFPLLSSLAGLIAGMFGVGGGIVKGPLMLEMGVLPDVAAATSATMM